MSKSILIKVDTETAEAFERLSAEEKEKIEFFLSLQMKNVLKSEVSLLDIMDDISKEAEAKGLTPEILESLLEEDRSLVKAIQEGENTPSVSREEVFNLLNSNI